MVDLPHPDSPTSPSVSPVLIEKLTSSTARTTPKCLLRFSAARIGTSAITRAPTGSSGLPATSATVSARRQAER